jgi:RNA polymerase sigma factor (sigma-70 family)
LSDIDELILACKANESWAQEKLFKLFGPKMLGICRRYLVSLDDAKDAMQDGFVKIFTNLHKYEGRSSFNTWITRIMMNTAIDSVKKLNKVQFVSDDHYFKDGGEEDYVEAPQLSQDQLLTLIDTMPTGYKMVFNMYAIDGLGHKEIGAVLGISEGTSKSQLNRARTYLKTEIIKLEQTLG